MRVNARAILCASLLGTRAVSARAVAQGASSVSATIEKPKLRAVANGFCRILSDGTFTANWGRSDLPLLAFTIGPKASMAKEMHASLASFVGPGRYPDVIVAVYLGSTALVDSYGGLGTITINPDGHSGSFKTNDVKAAGHFDCGSPPKRS
jgi:hypothetical protein